MVGAKPADAAVAGGADQCGVAAVAAGTTGRRALSAGAAGTAGAHQ